MHSAPFFAFAKRGRCVYFALHLQAFGQPLELGIGSEPGLVVKSVRILRVFLLIGHCGGRSTEKTKSVPAQRTLPERGACPRYD